MIKDIVIVAMAAGFAALEAGAASPPLEPLVACASIIDSSARLACFDREVVPLAAQISGRARPATPSAPPAAAPVVRAPVPAAPPATTAAAPSSFGQEQLAPERRPVAAPEDHTLHAHLTSQRDAGGGMFNLYLDNGQVWRHEDQMLGGYLRDGEAITIEKGALGSYKLSRDAGKSRNWIRVSRIR
jgi:hypothetical protein